ncbi:MAG: dTDP-glucose 4,6-dehydratase [Peptococcaceae bacterium]|nr:dTDP-glucose 4,6-dehydratase [Peptococcaceae bacterium]
MNILVTGGAGFIGSNFISHMLTKYENYKIVNYDLLTYAGNPNNLIHLKGYSNYKFVKGDIKDSIKVNQVLTDERIDCIVNFAAESHVDNSIRDPYVFIKTNVEGTMVLLNSALKNNIQKYIQISTDEVYGTIGNNEKFTEESLIAPNSPYSASKAGADMLARAYHNTYGMPVNIIRSSNNYGPYQFPEKLIPLMIINAINNKSLPVYGDGLQIRDWLYVKDNCAAIDLVLHRGENGEVYNVGGSSERTNLDVVRYILRYLNKDDSLISFVEDRLGHDRRYAVDCSKIMTVLGWRRENETFEKGLESTIQWYLDNQWWWEKL